jgi:hypothetical protein
MSDLMRRVRYFWFNNIPGTFSLWGHEITRHLISIYGGPNTRFNSCEICQATEWLSRLKQKNISPPKHSCSVSQGREFLCERQGDEMWTLYHQCFWFAHDITPELNAPKCLWYLEDEPYAQLLWRWGNYDCDQWMINLRRQFGCNCQIKTTTNLNNIENWSEYDFLFLMNTSTLSNIERPNIPVVMYGHDLWRKDAGYQKGIDMLTPDYFLTPFPTPWKSSYKFPAHTKIQFYPVSASQFFTRPNLNGPKQYDLLVLGALGRPVYKPRREFSEQVREIKGDYRIKYSHLQGCKRVRHIGPVEFEGRKTKIRFLNKWSEYLGSAKFVVFGPIEGPMNRQAVFIKHYECLGSGAIPILPEAPDMKLLGLKPMVHYIPFSHVQGDNERLEYYLQHYNKYKRIAKNAVNWHKKNADKLLFGGFQDFIQEVTNNKYPPRLIE